MIFLHKTPKFPIKTPQNTYFSLFYSIFLLKNPFSQISNNKKASNFKIFLTNPKNSKFSLNVTKLHILKHFFSSFPPLSLPFLYSTCSNITITLHSNSISLSLFDNILYVYIVNVSKKKSTSMGRWGCFWGGWAHILWENQ